MNILNALQGMDPALLGVVGQGVLQGTMVLGVYITYKLLNIADLTVDDSFTLGGCVCAILIVNRGMDPVATLALTTLAGMAAGFVTDILHTASGIPSTLAGILTQISLWSISLQIMSNKSNLPLLRADSMVTQLSGATELNQAQPSQVIGIIAAVIVVVVPCQFFDTEVGSVLKATDNNEDVIQASGTSTSVTRLLALMVSNGLTGMSGALVCQSQRCADIQMGTRATVVGLAAIVIGEVISGWFRDFVCRLAVMIIGSVIYFVIRVVVLQLGLSPNYIKLLSATIVAPALYIPVTAAKWKAYRAYSEGGES